MKKVIKSVLTFVVNCLLAFFEKGRLGGYMQTEILRNLMDRKKEVNYGSLILSFAIPNSLNRYRADTFVTKEPETLEWIDSIPNGSIFWDIGANVGLYSCYAAKKRNCRVFSFEPSVFNLELLARNIYLNDLGDRVTIIPLPLSEKLSFSKLNMTTKEWGGALSTYDQNYGHDGKPMRTVFNFPTIGLSMDESANLLKIPQPAYIKMDVDGIEHLILKGGKKVLSKVKGILIEINDSFDEQAKESRKYLEKAGFQLKEKRHAEEFNTGMAQFTFNQIWIRKMKTKA